MSEIVTTIKLERLEEDRQPAKAADPDPDPGLNFHYLSEYLQHQLVNGAGQVTLATDRHRDLNKKIDELQPITADDWPTVDDDEVAKKRTLPRRETKSKRKQGFGCDWPGCDRRFGNVYQLSYHKKTHKPDNEFVCQVSGCGKKFASFGNLTKHQLTHSVKCDYPGCKFVSDSLGNVQRHQKLKHEERLGCPLLGCPYRLMIASHLSKHLSTVHRLPKARVEQLVAEAKTKTASKVKAGQKQSSTLICEWPGCRYKTGLQKIMDHHKKSHEEVEEKPFQCKWSGCDEKFSTLLSLQKHLQRHTQDMKYHCDFSGCEYVTIYASKLKRHKQLRHTKSSKTSKTSPKPSLTSSTVSKGSKAVSIDLQEPKSSTATRRAIKRYNFDDDYIPRQRLKPPKRTTNNSQSALEIINEPLREPILEPLRCFACDWPDCAFKSTSELNIARHKALKHLKKKGKRWAKRKAKPAKSQKQAQLPNSNDELITPTIDGIDVGAVGQGEANAQFSYFSEYLRRKLTGDDADEEVSIIDSKEGISKVKQEISKEVEAEEDEEIEGIDITEEISEKETSSTTLPRLDKEVDQIKIEEQMNGEVKDEDNDVIEIEDIDELIESTVEETVKRSDDGLFRCSRSGCEEAFQLEADLKRHLLFGHIQADRAC